MKKRWVEPRDASFMDDINILLPILLIVGTVLWGVIALVAEPRSLVSLAFVTAAMFCGLGAFIWLYVKVFYVRTDNQQDVVGDTPEQTARGESDG